MKERDAELQAMRRKMDALKKTAASFRQLEKTLRTGEQRFEAIYRCLPVPTITWKRQGQDFTIIDYNMAAEEFTAGLMANFIGKRASLVYHDRPDIREKLARCFAEQSTLKEETPYRMFTKGDQKVIAFTLTYVPPDLVLSHMEDITGRKSAEEKIRRSEKQLRTLSTRLLTTAENERRHIARELHDSIGQYLTAIKLNAENTADLLARHQPEEAMTHLHAGIPLIRQTIDEIRRMMMDLRPTILDDLGILATLSWLCREMQAVHPRVALEKNIRIAERDIPEPLKIIIYRIVQESLHNALKHSEAAHIQIDLTEKRKQVVLAVTDNGVGFDPQAVINPERDGGVGLISMRERAELSGGVFSVRSKPGRGTMIRVSWAV